MCRGKEEEEGNVLSDGTKQEVSAHDHHESCELCGSEASLYCQADDAFLCRKCDKLVHGANFLAQRHIRCLFCSCCRGFTQRYIIGNSLEVVLPSIVLAGERVRCNSESDENCSKEEEIKMPFLFL